MTLSDFIKSYRQEHDLSQRAFGDKCGVSTGYISLIEKGINPRTGEVLIPQLPQLSKIAHGMGLSLNDLAMNIDDIIVDIEVPEKPVPKDELSDAKQQLIELVPQLPDDIVSTLIDIAEKWLRR